MPLALTLCVVFGFILWYQYKREADYRAEMYCQQLDLINRSVMKAYETDQTYRPYISFLHSYFSNSRFQDVRMSVYSDDGMLSIRWACRCRLRLIRPVSWTR